jgi:hypothetical protein
MQWVCLSHSLGRGLVRRGLAIVALLVSFSVYRSTQVCCMETFRLIHSYAAQSSVGKQLKSDLLISRVKLT